MGSYSDAGTSSSNNYDVDGNLTSVTVNNQQTTYSYDDFGQLVQLSSPDSGNHTFNYDIQNRVVTHNDARGTSHTSVKDLNGNVTSVSHVNGGNSQTENYSYDNQGHLTQMSDGSGTTTYSRNILGQVTSKTQNIGGKSFAVQYGYNGIGQKVSETYPSGLVISYSYNNGFLNSINVGGTSVVSNINYNSMLKEAISWNLGGSQVSVIKDADGLLTGFVDSGYFNQGITTDNEGHILSVTDNVSNNNFNIQLTPDYKIQSGTMNGNNLRYNYAYNHNLYGQNDGIANYNFNPSYYNNKVTNMTDQNWNYFYYQYDEVGNTTVDNKGTYAYDLNNNMISSSRTYTVNGSQITSTGNYVFNGLGHRVKKSVSGQNRYFVYNENNQLIGEYDNNGNVIAEYVYFGLRPVAVKNGSNINIVHTDYLTTPRIVTSGGSIVWQWRNDNPYGNNLAQGTIEFNLRFAGQYFDAESGLHYNIHRTYNPEIGRYMQSDPLGLSAGSNTYNYVGRNPFDAVDPLGLIVRLIVAEGDYNHIGHVAIDINGTTYGLMPSIDIDQTNVALFVPGFIHVQSFEEFKKHYFEPKEYVSTIHAYTINLSQEQENNLLKDIQQDINTKLVEGSKFNIFYQGTAYTENNCASWATQKINKYINNGVNIFPWTVRASLNISSKKIVLGYKKYEK